MVVVTVTVMSTIAMLTPLVAVIAPAARAGGLFLGSTIHDVAQVVKRKTHAEPRDGRRIATVVKLFRVALLTVNW